MSDKQKQTDVVLAEARPVVVHTRTTAPSAQLGMSLQRQDDELALQLKAEEGYAAKTALGLALTEDLYQGAHLIYQAGVEQMWDRADTTHNDRARRFIDAATEQWSRQLFRDLNYQLTSGVSQIGSAIHEALPTHLPVEEPQRRLFGRRR